ncbi:pYEATS domain-containing protein [Streptomyces sp. NPDC091280]|uniref:pYEATS domain-containing protein n=1 Tax=Streptomyces sp. NPDC091280 TaxID=3365984 RepID=UPI0037F24BAE
MTEGSNGAAPRVHLVHTAHRDSGLDKDGHRYFRIRIALEDDRDSDLDRVARVVYHLHPTFRDPNRTVTNRSTGFALTTAAWGNFSLTAEVYVKGDTEPIRLERYLDF